MTRFISREKLYSKAKFDLDKEAMRQSLEPPSFLTRYRDENSIQTTQKRSSNNLEQKNKNNKFKKPTLHIPIGKMNKFDLKELSLRYDLRFYLGRN